MTQPSQVFLERASYRRRRLIDSVALLPIAGLMLFMLPLFWGTGAEASVTTSVAMIYIFGIWLGLIVAAGLLSGLLRRPAASASDVID